MEELIIMISKDILKRIGVFGITALTLCTGVKQLAYSPQRKQPKTQVSVSGTKMQTNKTAGTVLSFKTGTQKPESSATTILKNGAIASKTADNYQSYNKNMFCKKDNTEVFLDPSFESPYLKLEKGTMVHVFGAFVPDMAKTKYYKVYTAYNTQKTQYIKQSDLTNDTMFQAANKVVYAKTKGNGTFDYQNPKANVSFQSGDSFWETGTSNKYIRVSINYKTTYIDKNYITDIMTFTPTNKTLFANGNISYYDNPNGSIQNYIPINTSISILGTSKNWAKIRYQNNIYYTPNGNLSEKKVIIATIPTFITANTPLQENSTLGNKIVKFALQSVGKPYVWGGTDLQHGADCSGFVQSVYKSFGITLARTTYDQINEGSLVPNISAAQPGDLVFYDINNDGIASHVAIYMGNNTIVQAANSRDGIITSSVYKPGAIMRIKRIV